MYRALRTPIECIVERGRVVDIRGAEDAREYKTLLEGLDDPQVFGIAEVGVGIHRRAHLSGTPLEDERILGSAWMALGTNVHLGGTVKAAIHSDCVMLPPVSLAVDGELLLGDAFDVRADDPHDARGDAVSATGRVSLRPFQCL